MTENTQFNQQDFEVVNREILYQGFFRLLRYSLRFRLFEGGWSETFDREILERAPAVAILPYDPILDRVILIEQFRAGSISDQKSPWMIEIPAGLIDKSEKPEEVAYRESLEEAGCTILNLHLICEYFASPGGSNELLTLYCGKVNAQHIEGIFGLKHEHEDIRVLNVPADDALARFYSGQIKNAPAIIALLWLQQNRQFLQTIW